MGGQEEGGVGINGNRTELLNGEWFAESLRESTKEDAQKRQPRAPVHTLL